MEYIKRHEIEYLDFYEEELEFFNEKLNTLGKNIEKHPIIIGSQFSDLFEALGTTFLLNRNQEEMVKYLSILQKLTLTVFQLGLNDKKKITVSFLGEDLILEGKETTTYVDFGVWQNCFYLSIILRDQEAINFLLSVPDTFLRNANVKGVEFDYQFVEFSKGIFTKDANIGELLIKSMKLTDRDIIPYPDRADYIIGIKVPELTLYRTFFSDDSAEFQIKLKEAINNHKSYWTKNDAEKPKGWVSLPLTALCVIAHDNKKWARGIESDYIPEWLIKGEF